MQVDMFQMFLIYIMFKNYQSNGFLKVSSYNGTWVCLPIKSPNCEH